MRRLLRLAGYALVVLSAGYFLAFVATHARRLPPIKVTPTAALALAGAFALSLTIVLLGALVWHLLLRAVGERPPAATSLGIALVSQLAKYLPGNVGHYLGRVALAREAGLAAPRVVVTLAYEVLLVVMASAAVVLALAACYAGPLLAFLPPGRGRWLLAGLAAGALGLLAGAPRLLRRRLARETGEAVPGGRLAMRLPGPPALAAGLGLGIATFLLHGVVLSLLLRGVLAAEGAAGAPLWLLTGVFAVSWLPGFLTPGAPGGLGVREAALVTALDPFLGPGGALALALLSRAVTLAAEGSAFAAGMLLRRMGEAAVRAAPAAAGRDAADRPR